ncbi:MAG TPA: cytochrome c [Candidatus Binatia bacterium]|nr:cytochrome c [Candidatus Binatia bacterium]
MKLRWLRYILLVAYGFGPAGALAQNVAEGKNLYTTYCTSCHGDQGKGDGVAARSLPVKPADHTNSAVMSQLSDKYLTDIITKGGSAVNKSGFMPAWGSSLNPKQVADIVAYVRSLSNSAEKGNKLGPK